MSYLNVPWSLEGTCGFSSTAAMVTAREAARRMRTAAMAALLASVPRREAHQLQSREERK